MVFCDYVSEKETDEMVLRLQTPDLIEPLFLIGGFKGHCAAFGWLGDFLLYSDRSGIHTEPGTYVLHVPDRELITENFLKNIIKKEEMNRKDYCILEKFVSDLDATFSLAMKKCRSNRWVIVPMQRWKLLELI